ncbi:MAG: anti-sigma factor family protein [Gemmatimonadaceae bacterium]
MNHRHLLPEEIDLLVDNEEGFGVAPLRTHLEGCPSCRARFDALATVVSALESLPHVAPAPRFTERVMSQVHVFEPWHVALRDSIRRWIPQSSVGKAVVGATGGVMAVLMTAIVIWIGRRADAVLFLSNLVMERTREGLASLLTETVVALFGATAATAVRNGGAVVMLGTAGLLAAAVVGVAFGVKAVATAGRSRRV